jgi:hypothetical protein
MAVQIHNICLKHLSFFMVKTKKTTEIQNIFDLAMVISDSYTRIKCKITSVWHIFIKK